MTKPSATCELYVNGTRVPDTAEDLVLAQPTALDGLTLTWGRDGQNEQPGPATCSFTILDRYAESDFLDRLHVGSTVALWAEGNVPGVAPELPTTYVDGSFSTKTDGAIPAEDAWYSAGSGGSWTYLDHAVKMAPPTSTSTTSYGAIAPQPFNLVSTDPPAVWDDIPRARVGETWRLELSVKAPVGVRWTVYLQARKSPYKSDATVNISTTGGNPDIYYVGTGDYQVISESRYIRSISGGVTSVWLLVGVSFTDNARVGRRWQDQTTSWDQQTTQWDSVEWDGASYLDNVAMYPPGTTDRRVLAFSGSVTDVVATPFGNGDTLQLDVTAADIGADLGNRVIGDVPWAVDNIAHRMARIVSLAGIFPTRQVIDEPIGALQVTARDVDAQPAFQLMQDLAQSGGGVLWAATHAVTGQYLWIENPAERTSLRELTLSSGLITIIGATDDVTIMSACDLLEEPVSWRQDTADVSTVVAVTWLEQGVNDEGQPTTTERTETVSDPTAITTYGTRRLSISTELINSADAISIANRALATARAVPWRIEGLTFDTDAVPDELATVDDASRAIALFNLLDGTLRMGLAITLVDMPAYAPRGSISDVYVEGGRYAYEQGAWTLSLAATPSGGVGTSAQWGQLDATWTWSQWSAALVWQDLYGVAA